MGFHFLLVFLPELDHDLYCERERERAEAVH